MLNVKPTLTSKTMLGLLVTLLAIVLEMVGVSVPVDVLMPGAEQLADAHQSGTLSLNLVVGIIAGVFAGYGRYVAEDKLSGIIHVKDNVQS